MINRFCANALLLEDFDIRNMSKWSPEKKVGVSVSRIYIQIAKFSNNVRKRQELLILYRAISSFDEQEYVVEPRYVPMRVVDVEKCFKNYLNKLPKKTFVSLDEKTFQVMSN